MLLVHQNPEPKSMPSVSTIPTYMWYFLPRQVNLLCATFKIFKIPLFMSLFLSSWGSSRELVITCDKQGHSPLFTRCWWFTSSLELTRERLKQNINITHHSPPHNENLRNQPNHWLVVKQRRKRNVLVSLKPAALTSLKALLVMGD